MCRFPDVHCMIPHPLTVSSPLAPFVLLPIIIPLIVRLIVVNFVMVSPLVIILPIVLALLLIEGSSILRRGLCYDRFYNLVLYVCFTRVFLLSFSFPFLLNVLRIHA
jgi:hypothetical protein